MIIVRSVPVVFAVRLVVLVVVADKVIEREAVMGSYEIDAGTGMAPVSLVEVARSGEPVAELGQLAVIALPVFADHIAIFAVPLGPQGRELADLVTSGPH